MVCTLCRRPPRGLVHALVTLLRSASDTAAPRVSLPSCVHTLALLLQNLDFDFEKCCSVSLSPVNVYVCLVCGKYFQVGAGSSGDTWGATRACVRTVCMCTHLSLGREGVGVGLTVQQGWAGFGRSGQRPGRRGQEERVHRSWQGKQLELQSMRQAGRGMVPGAGRGAGPTRPGASTLAGAKGMRLSSKTDRGRVNGRRRAVDMKRSPHGRGFAKLPGGPWAAAARGAVTGGKAITFAQSSGLRGEPGRPQGAWAVGCRGSPSLCPMLMVSLTSARHHHPPARCTGRPRRGVRGEGSARTPTPTPWRRTTTCS